MNASVLLLIASLFYTILIMILYFGKKRIESLENKIYQFILIASFFGILLDLLGVYVHINLPDTSIIRWIVLRLYHTYLLSILFLMSAYMLLEQKETRKTDRIKNGLIIIYGVSVVINFLLPVSYFKDGNIIYAYGPNITFLYAMAGIAITIWSIYMVTNLSKIKKKKHMPIITFVVLVAPIIYIQMTKPELLLVTSLISFIVVIMYHTIENPDMKLINELNIAKSQAEKANNAKSDFLSNMSHEIRTPLNAIVGFSQVLLERELEKEAKEEVKDIIMASEGLLEIVNGILDISKIEAGKLEIINKEYRFKKTWEDLVALTKARLGDKPLEFKINYDESIPPVLYGDSTRVKQVILNVLTNSVKYTREGYVDFTVSSVIKDGVCRLIISVEDSGIGIKPDKIEKLFTKFQRLDEERNTTIEGTGLGLAITKRLLELMDGQITVQSKYGEGSKFTIAIDQKIVENPTIEIEEVKKEQSLNLVFPGKKILLVDDNKINLKVANRLLQSYKVDIEEALSGFECIEKIEAGNVYDLILLDDMMPKMSGIETLAKLKGLEKFNIPTVAFTANAISGMREKYLDAGFNDYLSKPLQKSELNQILIKYLENGGDL